MKERPIIFSGESVRAILGGTKAQTRRILNPQPEHAQIYDWRGKRLHESEYRHWCWRQHVGADNFFDITGQLGHACPLGIAGDRLWVREAWMPFERAETMRSVSGGPFMPTGDYLPGGIGYKADLDKCAQVPVFDGKITVCRTPEGPWKSPIHMPRWASRLTLEVVSVRVEKLQEISVEDVQAEGIVLPCTERNGHACPLLNLTASPLPGDFSPKLFKDWTEADFWRHAFAIAWDKIHGKGAWMLNPYVWRIEFRRVER